MKMHFTYSPLAGSLAVLSLACLLSACAVGPEYRRPDMPASEKFRNAPSVDVVPDSLWWRGFEDATLNALVDQALAGNHDIAQAIARLEQAQAGLRRARAEQLPRLGVEAAAGSQRESLESAIGRVSRDSAAFERNHEDYTGSLALSWEIDLFGRLRRQAQAAGAFSEAAQADLRGMKIAIVAQTTDAYLSWRQAHALLALLERRIAVRTAAVELSRDRFEAKVANVNELRVAKAALFSLEAERPALTQAIEMQRNRLAVLTGTDPSKFSLSTPPDALPKFPGLTGFEQPADLLRRRPDVAAAEQRLIAATAGIGSALAGYYPSFSLNGLLGWQATTTGAFGSGDSAQAAGLLGLRWRLFDFGRVGAEIRQARGRQAEALAVWQQTQLRATEEVENALMAMQTSYDAYRLHGQTKADLKDVWNSAQQSFGARTIGRLPVLDSEDRLLASQQQQTTALYAHAKAAVWLNKAAAAM